MDEPKFRPSEQFITDLARWLTDRPLPQVAQVEPGRWIGSYQEDGQLEVAEASTRREAREEILRRWLWAQIDKSRWRR